MNVQSFSEFWPIKRSPKVLNRVNFIVLHLGHTLSESICQDNIQQENGARSGGINVMSAVRHWITKNELGNTFTRVGENLTFVVLINAITDSLKLLRKFIVTCNTLI
jgi:hypothetical protein